MLIERYDLEMFTPPCSPGSARFAAIARFDADIGAVLPLLNATLDGALYVPGAPALTWRGGGRPTTFRPHEIAAADLEDRTEATAVLDDLVALVNRTYEGRDAIRPDHTFHRRPTPLDIHRLLPRTDCRACGQPTCYMFAVQVAAGRAQLAACPPLHEPASAAQRAALEDLLRHAPAPPAG